MVLIVSSISPGAWFPNRGNASNAILLYAALTLAVAAAAQSDDKTCSHPDKVH